MLGEKFPGKRTLEIEVYGGGVNTNYGIIPIISNRNDSFRNLVLGGIKDEKLQRSVRTEIQFSDFILTTT